ncbi:MAG: AEC family transporter [Bacteroidales bacterium]
MATAIILRQLLIFSILIGVGALAYWRKIITPEIKDNLARVVIDITLPFLIFTTFANIEADASIIKNGLLVFALAFVNLFVFYLVGKFSSRLLKLKQPQETVHTLHTMFGNIVFLGFPLLDALFPNGIGIFYGAMYQLASNTITFTYGVYKLSAGTQKSGIKSLINPNTIGLFLGAAVLLMGVTLPSFLNTSLSSLGQCTSPLSMVYIGAMLASIKIKSAIRQKSIYLLSLNKLLIVPVALAVVYHLAINAFGIIISEEAFFVLILQAAMPCQTIIVVLSHRYNGDHVLAGANLFVTTLLSIITLPLVFYLVSLIRQVL